MNWKERLTLICFMIVFNETILRSIYDDYDIRR